MKKIFKCLLAITCCLSLTSCKKSGIELTQKKIEDAGWKIDLSTIDSINCISLKIDDPSAFVFTTYEGKKQVKEVSYCYSIDSDYYSYSFKENRLWGTVSQLRRMEFICKGYNPDNQAFINGKLLNVYGDDCTDEYIENLRDIADKLKSILEEYDFTYDELEQWANWYFEQNLEN